MTEEGREGIRNIWLTGVGQIGRFILLLATAITIPRLFGPEVYGQFSVVMAVVSILYVFSVLGLRFAELRILAPIYRNGEGERAVSLASLILNLRIVASLVAAVVCGLWLFLSSSVSDWILLFGAVLFALSRYWLDAARSLLLPLDQVPWYIAIDLISLLLTLCSFILGYLSWGLSGAFFMGSAVGLLLFCLCLKRNNHLFNISQGKPEWSKIAPLLSYSPFVLLSTLFITWQASLPIWILSRFGPAEQVAYLGVSVQILLTLRGMLTAFWQSLMPIMSTLQENNEHNRLIEWVSLVMRVVVALCTIVTIVWLIWGREIAVFLLGDDYAQVFPCVSMMLLSVAGFFLGACSNGVALLLKRVGLSAVNHLVFLVSTLTGILWLYNHDLAGDAYRMSQVYAASSIVFFIFSYVSLWVFGNLKLPLGRVIVLLLPIYFFFSFMFVVDEPLVKLICTIVLVTFYLLALFFFRLIHWSEVKYAILLLRGKRMVV